MQTCGAYLPGIHPCFLLTVYCQEGEYINDYNIQDNGIMREHLRITRVLWHTWLLGPVYSSQPVAANHLLVDASWWYLMDLISLIIDVTDTSSCSSSDTWRNWKWINVFFSDRHVWSRFDLPATSEIDAASRYFASWLTPGEEPMNANDTHRASMNLEEFALRWL